eukprot:scaffold75191_cov48-Phaeocystis_antarctica.AAC.2
MPYCVCMMSWGSSSYSRKKPMEPKATPHRAACKRWGVVGGGAGCAGLSETRLVCTGRRRGGGRRWGRARAGDGPVDETPGRAWANVCARQVGSCVRQRERDASGKRAARAAPRTRRALYIVEGRSRTGKPSFNMPLSPDIPRARRQWRGRGRSYS